MSIDVFVWQKSIKTAKEMAEYDVLQRMCDAAFQDGVKRGRLEERLDAAKKEVSNA